MSRFHTVFLMVSNLTESRLFYEDILGLEIVDQTSDHIRYGTDLCELIIQQDFNDSILEVYNVPVPAGEQRGGGAVFNLDVELELEAVQKTVEDHPEAKPDQILFGPRAVEWHDEPIMIVQDPDGYLFELRSL